MINRNRSILILVNTFDKGGAESFAFNQFRHLKNEYRDVSFYALEDPGTANILDLFAVGKNRVLLKERKNSGLWKLILLFKAAAILKREIKNGKDVCIVSHTYRANYVNVLVRVLGSRHKCLLVNHSSVTRYYREGLKGLFNIGLIRWLYPKADRIVAITRGMEADLKKFIPLSRHHKMQVVYNFLDITGIIGEAQLPPEKEVIFPATYLVTMGRLIPLKNQALLIKALYLLEKKYNIIRHLVIIGSGPDRERLQQLAARYGLQDRVHMVGTFVNPHTVVRGGEIFLLGSDVEGLPSVLIEALACEVPVIATDCVSGPREILAPGTTPLKRLVTGDMPEMGKYGILVPVQCEVAMAAALYELITNTGLYKAIKAAGRRRAFDFSPERILPAYIALIET